MEPSGRSAPTTTCRSARRSTARGRPSATTGVHDSACRMSNIPPAGTSWNSNGFQVGVRTASDRAAAARQFTHRQRPPSGGLFYGWLTHALDVVRGGIMRLLNRAFVGLSLCSVLALVGCQHAPTPCPLHRHRLDDRWLEAVRAAGQDTDGLFGRRRRWPLGAACAVRTLGQHVPPCPAYRARSLGHSASLGG